MVELSQVRPLSALKNLLLPSRSGVHTIQSGPFRGLRMNLNLSDQAQIWLGLAEHELRLAPGLDLKYSRRLGRYVYQSD